MSTGRLDSCCLASPLASALVGMHRRGEYGWAFRSRGTLALQRGCVPTPSMTGSLRAPPCGRALAHLQWLASSTPLTPADPSCPLAEDPGQRTIRGDPIPTVTFEPVGSVGRRTAACSESGSGVVSRHEENEEVTGPLTELSLLLASLSCDSRHKVSQCSDGISGNRANLGPWESATRSSGD